MDVMHACRCCLRCPSDKDLETPYTYLGKTEIYADMIKECFDIHLVLGGSGSCGICSACVGRLRDASDFKLQVQRSHAELQALLVKAESAVKPEQADDSADDDSVLDMLYEDPLAKSETDDVMSDGHSSAAECSDGSAARAREQLATACSVVLERLRGDATANSGGKPYSCDHCGMHFRNKTFLRKHIASTHLSTGPKPFACDFSSTTFQTKSLEIEHEKSKHGITNLMCAECEYTTSSKKSLETHIKSHSVENNFKSSHYKDIRSCESDLHKHQSIHIDGKPFNYSDYNLKCNQRTNQMIHTGKKPFTCSYCGNKFSRKSHLKLHLMIHTGEKPFKCSNCEYKCRRKDHLLTHQKIHTGEKPYTCSYCGFRCNNKSNLLKHKKKHTDEKYFQCSHCDYKSTLKFTLKRHQRIHTAEKPYSCSYCDFRCNDMSNLQKHKKKHTDEKSFYQCRHCDYKSNLKSTLKRHQIIHTKAKP
ncbi:gastrula zinc finger protein XlCGF57.1-like [Cydia pomonella]|uniref:gastrula zinc finger protein XlCGF57.1-like n=1 Tax=Cydia pomonella TaxID=82600 RepID=UPI002ADE2BE5|nr:gastrula zinc finger protein XlCGF57.1-like [Cydia pomonella]